MISYLIKSIVCSGILLGVYYLFLEREKTHHFNRFYLLSAYIVSWIIPLISFTIVTPKIIQQTQTIFSPSNFIAKQPSETIVNAGAQHISVDYFPIIIISIYVIVTCIFLVRFIINLYKIIRQIHLNKKEKLNDYSLIFILNNNVTFSFFKYIFPAKEDLQNQKLEQNILQHELVHVKEKHSIDILFMELMKVFLWINPFVVLYKKAIQLNHEFIADDEVVKKEKDVILYQNLLLSKITHTPISQLASSSNYSITKKRFIMMTKKTNRAKAILLRLCVIPLCGILIFGFSKRVVASPIISITSNAESSFIIQDSDIVTRYNVLLNSIKMTGTRHNGKSYVGYKAQRSVLLDLQNMYNSMSDEQKAQVVKLPPPLKNPSIPKRVNPTTDQLNKWQNNKLYGIWLDEKRIDNKSLANYTPSDIVYYNASNLTEIARKNDGFNVQLELYTEEGYQKLAKDLKNYNPEKENKELVFYVPDKK